MEGIGLHSNDDIILTPIVNINTNQCMHCFKVCYRDVVELRIIKEKIIDQLKEDGLTVDDKTGWYE